MAKLNVKDFSTWLKEQVGNAYCWGAQGESVYNLVRSLADRNNQSKENTDAMLSYMSSHGARDIKFYDCSGLGVKYLLDKQAITFDTTADGLYRKCTPIDDSEVTEGCWGFFKNANGKIYHIGYVVDNDMIVHAFNQEKGVIMEKRTDRKWIYARPDFAFAFEKPQKPLYDTLSVGDKVTIDEDIKGYNDEYSALKGGKESVIYPKGSYYVYKKSMGSVNITRNKSVPGAWVVL